MYVLHPVSIVEDSHAVVHRTVDSCDCMKALEKMTSAYKRSENHLCVFPVWGEKLPVWLAATAVLHLRTIPLDTGKGGGRKGGRLHSGRHSTPFYKMLLYWYLKSTWTIFAPSRIFCSCPLPRQLTASTCPLVQFIHRYILFDHSPDTAGDFMSFFNSDFRIIDCDCTVPMYNYSTIPTASSNQSLLWG